MISRATIDGMRSVHCVRAVFTAMGGVAGIVRADVSMGAAVVEHDPALRVEELRAALAAIGYELTGWTSERRLPVL